MVSVVNSAGVFGLEAYIVEVQTDIIDGKTKTEIIGLPDTAVSESAQRVHAALINSGYALPPKNVIVNLAPADIRKEGALYDLPIFLGLIRSEGHLRIDLSDSVFIGELSLAGDVRRVSGALPMTIKAARSGFSRIFLPAENVGEASVVEGIRIYPVSRVSDLIAHLKGEKLIEPVSSDGRELLAVSATGPDMADVRGQYQAKRAVEIAAAGGHNLLMIGSPGSGKSMIASRIPSILPEMSFEEAIETTKIYSVAGLLRGEEKLITRRPFRAPHHTISMAGLAGGGTVPRPGEVSLAHNGVLFLDELPEFSRAALEVLRQPIESNIITISRAAGSLTYPCSVMLVCAMNPCPCGYYGSPNRKCSCPPGAPRKYLSKISGPLLDRIDVHIEVQPVNFDTLRSRRKEEPSEAIRARVNEARRLQRLRLAGSGVSCNAKMDSKQTARFCALTAEAESAVREIFDRDALSSRAYDKILKLARTCADLDGSGTINIDHVYEAMQLRALDRKYWQN